MKTPTNRTDDRAFGAAIVATLFAFVGAGSAAVMWDFGINETGGTFIVLWLLIFLALSLGWRNSLPPPGSKRAPTASRSSTTASAPSASAPSAPAAPTATAQASSSGTAPAAAPETAEAVVEETVDGSDEAAEATADGASEGTRPEALEAPRDGTADDLKQIKGVGPALERLCNSLGFYHFDQIAAWTEDEVAWVDQNLEGFKGRVSRDNWVDQAKTLAAGGTTEFSKKVSDGDVY